MQPRCVHNLRLGKVMVHRVAACTPAHSPLLRRAMVASRASAGLLGSGKGVKPRAWAGVGALQGCCISHFISWCVLCKGRR